MSVLLAALAACEQRRKGGIRKSTKPLACPICGCNLRTDDECLECGWRDE